MRLRALRESTRLGIALVAVTLGAQAAPIRQADPSLPAPQRPAFRVATTLVPVDVRVVDKKGVPVTDLKASEFVVLEDKVPQQIAHFSTTAFTPEEAPPADSRPPRASDAFEIRAANHRTFLIVLARGWLQIPSKGVDAAIHLVRDLALPQDYVAVMAWNRATDFTTNRDVALAVLERFKKDHVGIEVDIAQWQKSLAYGYGDGQLPTRIQVKVDAVFGGPRAPRVRTMESSSARVQHLDDQRTRILAGAPDLRDEYEGRGLDSLDQLIEARARTGDDLASLYLGIEYLRHLSGQKHVIFVSEYGIAGDYDDDRSIGRRAADARVVLDVIHAGGMPWTLTYLSPPPNMIATGVSAKMYSGLSGGQFFAHKNRNSSIDLDRIDEASKFFYTLAYYPAKDPTDGKYRRVQVKVTRPGLTVLARDGYFARADIGPLETRKAVSYGRVAGAAEFVRAITDLGLADISARPGVAAKPPQVRVAVTIDLSRVAFDRVDDLNIGSLEVAAFAVNKGREQAGHRWDTVSLAFTDARLAELRRTGLRYELTIDLTGKADEVKLVAYDYGADLVGSAVVTIAKP
jgi:VWFA-related protein